jgi:hypothetical protein
MSQADSGYSGPLDHHSEGSDYNALSFLVQQLLGRAATTTLVQVVACTNAGGLAAVGVVDVHPMVAQIDGVGNITPHGVIYGLPYMRLQGGANAVIIDPVVGDIGLAVICAQDISKVKATKKEGPPGSRRRFDLADGLYIGGVLNAVPTSFIRFGSDGVYITSPTKVTLTAPDIELVGNTNVTGTVIASGDVTGNGTHLHTHTHSGVTTGGGTSGPPV